MHKKKRVHALTQRGDTPPALCPCSKPPLRAVNDAWHAEAQCRPSEAAPPSRLDPLMTMRCPPPLPWRLLLVSVLAACAIATPAARTVAAAPAARTAAVAPAQRGLAPPTSRARGYRVGAYYFSGWSHAPNNNITSVLTGTYPLSEPLSGWYDDSQRQVDATIAQAAASGITFFAFDWY